MRIATARGWADTWKTWWALPEEEQRDMLAYDRWQQDQLTEFEAALRIEEKLYLEQAVHFTLRRIFG